MLYWIMGSLLAGIWFSKCASEKKVSRCDKFHNGTFILQSEIDQSVSVIDRNDTVQVEKNLADGTETVAKIKWLTSCKYELTNISSSGDSSIRSIEVEIVKSNKEYYIFRATTKGIDLVLTDTLRIIK